MPPRKVQITTQPTTAKFYVMRPPAEGHIGRRQIETEANTGHAVVTMTAAEAQYWLDQGVLSGAPPNVVQERRDNRRVSAERNTTAEDEERVARHRRESHRDKAAAENDPADRLSIRRKSQKD